MSFFKKKGSVEIPHFAPDLTVTPVDYQVPVQDDQRIQMAEKRFRRFLAETAPDKYCETFFDGVVESENQRLIRTVLAQSPEHLEVNRLIAQKHKAESARLKANIAYMDDMIVKCQEELDHLSKVYAYYNNSKYQEE